MTPPFTITSKITNLVAEIAKLLGGLEATTLSIPNPKLRKQNRIKTIKSTLAIEGHTFTFEQVTAILEKKKVLGPKKEILEVQNAIALYEQIDTFKSVREKDLLDGHKILMNGLIKDAGKYRSKNVGIIEGSKVKHLAPKPNLVPEHMKNLFAWIKKEIELHPLILSSIVHYEIEFIHPFEDGNGRMGRFWQALILKKYDNFFRYVPIESLIEKHQTNYYKALEKSDGSGESTPFIEFILRIIKLSLEEISSEIIGITHTSNDRLEKAQQHFKVESFSRKNYMELFKNISSATASRDLKDATDKKLLKQSGNHNQTKYYFKTRE